MLANQVFELDAIAGWLARNPSNPLTREEFDYSTTLAVNPKMLTETAHWRSLAVAVHAEAAEQCNDPAKAAWHLTAAIEADPRSAEGYERLAIHLSTNGDPAGALEIQSQAVKMQAALAETAAMYNMSSDGKEASVVPMIRRKLYEEDTMNDEILAAAIAEDPDWPSQHDEDQSHLESFMTILAIAQVSKACVWAVVANSAVSTGGAAVATGAAATTGAVAGSAAAGTAAAGAGTAGAVTAMAAAGTAMAAVAAAGAILLTTTAGVLQVHHNRMRKRKSFFKVQRMLGRRH